MAVPFARAGTTRVALARPGSISVNRPASTGRESFHIGADKGLFSAIGLQAVAGRSVIDEVKIEYVDAYGKIQWQTVFPRQQLDGRNQTLTIALAPGVRAVNNIMVYGSTDRGSAYKLIAQ